MFVTEVGNKIKLTFKRNTSKSTISFVMSRYELNTNEKGVKTFKLTGTIIYERI